jgi:hypothetical protein
MLHVRLCPMRPFRTWVPLAEAAEAAAADRDDVAHGGALLRVSYTCRTNHLALPMLTEVTLDIRESHALSLEFPLISACS